MEDLKGDTSGNFLQVLKNLLLAPAEFDAYQCHKAIKVNRLWLIFAEAT